MNWIDFSIIGVIFASMILGMLRGFVKEIISLMTWVAAFFVASLFANKLAIMFAGANAEPSSVTIAFSFGLLFLATMLAGRIIGFVFSSAINAGGILSAGDRLFGAIFGLARGFIFTLAVVFIVQLTAFGSDTAWHESHLVNAYQPAVDWLGKRVSPALENLKSKYGESASDTAKEKPSAMEGMMNYFNSPSESPADSSVNSDDKQTEKSSVFQSIMNLFKTQTQAASQAE